MHMNDIICAYSTYEQNAVIAIAMQFVKSPSISNEQLFGNEGRLIVAAASPWSHSSYWYTALIDVAVNRYIAR